MDVTKELSKLEALLRNGLVLEEEYIQQKQEIQAGGSSKKLEPPIDCNEWLNNLPAIFTALSSSGPEQLEALVKIKRLLSIDTKSYPCIDEVVDIGVVPLLTKFLQSDNPLFQFTAAHSLSNIAAGTTKHVKIVVESGAVVHLVALLSTGTYELKTQAAWSLANIAGDSTSTRNYVLAHGAMEALLGQIDLCINEVCFMQIATWAISNLCRGKPAPMFALVSPALRVLSRLIFATDQKILQNALWAIAYLSDGSDDQIETVLQHGVARRIVDLLQSDKFPIVIPALRAVGGILSGTEIQTQLVLNLNVLVPLESLINSPNKDISKEALWAISNITAGTQVQIQAVLSHPQLMPKLITLLNTTEDKNIAQEAIWIIKNAARGTPEQSQCLVEYGVIPLLCKLILRFGDAILSVALAALLALLQASPKDGNGNLVYALEIEKAGGISELIHLQNHQDGNISYKATQIGVLLNYGMI